ncbi:MAG: carboxypeptidase regulatory-like domain-containing protein [Gemmatimonadaceae bacterium]
MPSSLVRAQGITTGGLTGTVTDTEGKPIEAAQIILRNPLTGYTVNATTRASGLYVIQGLEPNPSYTMSVRAIGFGAINREGIFVSLGQTRRENYQLTKQATQLTEVTVTATAYDNVINTNKTGASTTISDSALRRLPTLNRNFADFVAAVPQVSTTTGYLSGGGVNLRQNAIQIDGAQAGDVFGLGTTGQAGASSGAKSIPLDAVKEYQVLLSPFDVRQGGFGGLLINAVTKSGTNDFHGGVYAYTRNQDLTRKQPYLTDFSQQQYGASIGGRIIRDKLFFFLNGEVQQLQTPASGAYLGGTGTTAPYVSQEQITQLQTALAKYGFTDVGTGARVDKKNPNRNLFARVDANLPFSTRLILRHNYASADNRVFSRGLATSSAPTFNLTSNGYDISNTTNGSVVELLTSASNGIYNEFLANYTTIKDFRTIPVRFPQLTIRGFQRTDATGLASIQVGTDASSQGNSLDQRTIEFTDNLTIPLGTHSLTVGGKVQLYRSINLFAQNSIGNWQFASLDALNNGIATQYQFAAPAPTDLQNGLATVKGKTLTGYISDTWQATPGLSLSLGFRIDKPTFDNLPPYNISVDTVYGRKTNVVANNAQFSPRFGFNWDLTGDKRNQLRGGVGSFSGPTPFVYISNVFGNSDLSGYGAITCNNSAISATSTTSLNVPAFTTANLATPPTACLPGTRPNGTTVPGSAISGPSAGAAVNTIDPNFKNPKYLKGSLGFDHRFGNGFVATLEGLYTYSQNNAFYQNLALDIAALDAMPIADRTGVNGRLLYGTLAANGATPTTRGSRRQVLDVTNSSGDYTYNLTAQLQKSFTTNFDASLAYTFQQSRDVASTTSSTAGSNYRFQRDVSGDILKQNVTKSKYDQPHRIIAAGSYHFKTFTDVAIIYSGSSGAPFDFTYGNAGRSSSGPLGDVNGDGNTANDLMYVPKNATDQTEIYFQNYNSTNAALKAASDAQAVAFEKLISDNDCLNSQRGTIMERNSCRNPWINRVDLSLSQSLGKLGGSRFQNVQVRLDVINFTNLLNKNWGEQAFSDQNDTCGQICSATVALVHTGNVLPAGLPATTKSSNLARGVFTFSPTYNIFNSDNASSNYRMQLSARYSF